jgi:hypothetical protein
MVQADTADHTQLCVEYVGGVQSSPYPNLNSSPVYLLLLKVLEGNQSDQIKLIDALNRQGL